MCKSLWLCAIISSFTGCIKPIVLDCDVLDISYVGVDDAVLRKTVEQSISGMSSLFFASPLWSDLSSSCADVVFDPSFPTTGFLQEMNSSGELTGNACVGQCSKASNFVLCAVLLVLVSRSSCRVFIVRFLCFCAAFYSTTSKKSWFSSANEKIYWERWIIPIRYTPFLLLASPALV